MSSLTLPRRATTRSGPTTRPHLLSKLGRWLRSGASNTRLQATTTRPTGKPQPLGSQAYTWAGKIQSTRRRRSQSPINNHRDSTHPLNPTAQSARRRRVTLPTPQTLDPESPEFPGAFASDFFRIAYHRAPLCTCKALSSTVSSYCQTPSDWASARVH